MKQNKLNKKLTLNKKTLANLNPLELGNIRGGSATTDTTSCNYTICLKCGDTF